MKLRIASLRTRLLLLVAVAYLPAVILTIWTAQRESEQSLQAVRARLQQLLDIASTDNDNTILAGRRILGTWAEVPAVRTGERAACEEAFVRLSALVPQVASPTRFTALGIVDCGGRTPAAIGGNVSASPLFAKILSADTSVLGPYLAAERNREPLVPLNIAVQDRDGTVTSVLSIGIRLMWLARLQGAVAAAGLAEGAVISIGDSAGTLIGRLPYAESVGSKVPQVARVFSDSARPAAPSSGFTEARGVDGVLRLIAYRRLASAPGFPTVVAIGVLPAVAYAEPAARLRVRVFWLVVTALAALVIAWLGAEYFVLRDVTGILDATRKLGAGDLTARTGVTRQQGELAQLASAFDTMAAQLEVRQERLRHAEKMESLGRLAGGVAHDFNNLITAIVGSADLALDSLPADHEAREDLAIIKAAAGRSSSLTRQLLTFSQQSPVSGPTQRLESVVYDAVALLSRVVPASVELAVESHSARLVRVDSGRVEQALMNLAVNARDAMPSGGRLTIRLDDVDVAVPAETARSAPGAVPSGRWVRLQVQDTGLGMPPDVLRRVFEPFFTTKAPGAGTGLGLAMVYGTVAHHGGVVQVESTVNVGTTVTIWLPEAQEDTVDHPVALAVSGRGGRSAGRILLAEDEPGVQAAMQRSLTRVGYEVLCASNGREAIALATEQIGAIDVLVTDFEMPHANGEAVVRAARALRADLPVVLTSGYARDGWPAALLALPHVMFLDKPFEAEELLQAVEQVQRSAREA